LNPEPLGVDRLYYFDGSGVKLNRRGCAGKELSASLTIEP